MRQHLILSVVLTIALTACSSVNSVTDTPAVPMPTAQTVMQLNTPSATATARKTSTRFPTRPATPSPPSPTISAIPTLGFDLPSACNKIDPAIDAGLYKEYNLAYGACGYPSRSPDGSLLAYVTLVPTMTVGNRPDAIPVVQLYSFATKETTSIYQAQCVFLKLRWASTGQLVILDSPYDVGCGYSAVYEPTQGKIIAMLDGIAFDHGNWADDDSAFFVLRGGGYGPTCDDALSVFDLSLGILLPPIKPTTPDTKIYAVVGQPIWMPDTKTLLVTLRDGICTSEADCEYRNSYVIAYTRTDSTLKENSLFFDPAIDYSFHRTEQGTIEFRSMPFKPVSCYDIHSTDGT